MPADKPIYDFTSPNSGRCAPEPAGLRPAVTATAWLLVLGYAGHGLKDYWQHRRQYVVNTRWWPPFCAAVDWLVALLLIIEIVVGVNLHQ